MFFFKIYLKTCYILNKSKQFWKYLKKYDQSKRQIMQLWDGQVIQFAIIKISMILCQNANTNVSWTSYYWTPPILQPENIFLSPSLTYLLPMHSFSTPWNYQKTVRFSDVLQGVKKGYIESKWVNRPPLPLFI